LLLLLFVRNYDCLLFVRNYDCLLIIDLLIVFYCYIYVDDNLYFYLLEFLFL